MSATVAYIAIALSILAVFAVFGVGWWMTEKTLSEDEDEEPPAGGNAV